MASAVKGDSRTLAKGLRKLGKIFQVRELCVPVFRTCSGISSDI